MNSELEYIVDPNYCIICYSHSKNRFYLTLRGIWDSISTVSTYVKDWEKALLLASPSFTLLTDATKVQAAPPSRMKIHSQAQQLLVDAGLLQVAEVLPQNAFLDYQAEVLAEGSKMARSKFSTIEQAEEWLNKLQRLRTN